MLGDAWTLAAGRRHRGWVYGLMRALRSRGAPVVPSSVSAPPIDLGVLRAALTAQGALAFEGLADCPRTAPRVGARRCTYAHWFMRRGPEDSVLAALVPPSHLRSLLRLRTGCHGLPRDLGSRAGVPRALRLCPLCIAGPGDELHALLECNALQGLRDQFPMLSFAGPLRLFIWQLGVQHVAAFVHRVLGLYET